MGERGNMKIVYTSLVLILTVSALGCIGNKPSEVTPTSQVTSTQVETSISPTETPVSATTSNDEFGTQSDISTIDSLVNDSNMDIPLYDVNI